MRSIPAPQTYDYMRENTSVVYYCEVDSIGRLIRGTKGHDLLSLNDEFEYFRSTLQFQQFLPNFSYNISLAEAL